MTLGRQLLPDLALLKTLLVVLLDFWTVEVAAEIATQCGVLKLQFHGELEVKSILTFWPKL